MERIAHRDLRNSSSEVLRRVQAGESFEVTNHGVVVAMLVPADAARPPLPGRAPRIHGSFAALLAEQPVVSDDSMAAIDDLRDDER